MNPLKNEGDEVLVNPNIYSDFSKSLVHIFRNSMDHGIESMDDRYNAKKEENATIKCVIKKQDDNILLTISDDGKGIDANILRDKLKVKGIEKMTDKQVIDLIWDDGMTTNTETTDLSGRGIGLAAVKSETEKLGGNVLVKTKIGEGTTFYFSLPFNILK
jgi:two-component system chemotaxis sensor kinase CheA